MKRFLLLLVVSLVISITAYLYPWIGLKIIPDAIATGGAFIYTKHGGGTTDGLTPCAGGVNRGLGADYGVSDPCNTLPGSGSYNTANTEAGTYGSGECLHCHEPMGSFGGGEPHPNTTSAPPDTAGPTAYLLFKGDYNSATQGANAQLCWYCHQGQSNINNSGSPATMGRWSFYQGKTVYEASTHYTNPRFPTFNMSWPGTTETSASTPKLIWPRTSRLTLPAANRGSCLNCHTPHGIKAADAANAYDTVSSDGSTGGVPAAFQTTATNQSVMADYLIPRKLIAWEENLCERCHRASGAGGVAPDIQTEINKRHPVGGAGSGHPIDDTTTLVGRHTVRESIPITIAEGGRPVTLKHVECYDCHNPHAIKQGGSTPHPSQGTPFTWDDGGRLKGVRYITINGTICDPVSSTNPAECTTITIGNNTFTKTSPQPFIYELCFKCHGDSYASFIPDRPCSPACADGNPLRTTVAQNGCVTRTPASTCTDGSNKRLEFSPNTPANDGFGGTITTTGLNRDTTNNKAFHPVATPGRNTSLALCYQLKARGFPSLDCTETSLGSGLVNSLANLTIYCTDCHNTNAAGIGTFSGTTATPTYPGPITESSLRPTDVASSYPSASVDQVGPHGSINPRILRANYNTQFTSFGSFNAANFALCFQCHSEEPFTREDGTANVPGVGRVRATNFFQASVGPAKQSLHWFHVFDRTNSSCINCHYNIHSNYEQAHTQYGPSTAVSTPQDGDTHLVNFSPAVGTNGYAKPAWFRNGTNMGCTLTCHNQDMDGQAPGGGGGRDARYEINPS